MSLVMVIPGFQVLFQGWRVVGMHSQLSTQTIFPPPDSRYCALTLLGLSFAFWWLSRLVLGASVQKNGAVAPQYPTCDAL